MSLLKNTEWKDARVRVLIKALKRCSIKDIQEREGEPDANGRVLDRTIITLRLEEDAECTDHSVFKAGGTVEVSLNTTQSPQNPTDEAMNRISYRLWRDLVVAALGLPLDCPDAPQELANVGGETALIGRLVAVTFSPGRGDRNNANKFERVKAD